MGCSSSKDTDAAVSSNVLKNSTKASDEPQEKLKFLLLGSGECGKSTIFKQMRIHYSKTDWSEEELKMYGVVIRSNVVTAIRKLSKVLEDYELDEDLAAEEGPQEAYEAIKPDLLDNYDPANDDKGPDEQEEGGDDGDDEEEKNIDRSDWVGNSPKAGPSANADAELFLKHWKSIQILWKSQTMKEVWQKRSHMNVIDCHKNYLDDLDRIASPDFKPTTQDILYARIKSTKIVTHAYQFGGKEFEIYDVGGQRVYRKHWMQHFKDVDGVIAVAALSEYDQQLAEAKNQNRMIESLNVFKTMCDHDAFRDKPIILFLNKKDIFEEKIMYSDIKGQKAFDDFTGNPKDFKQGVNYFMEKFRNCSSNTNRTIETMVTTATDSNNMKFILDATNGIIMRSKLKNVGLL